MDEIMVTRIMNDVLDRKIKTTIFFHMFAELWVSSSTNDAQRRMLYPSARLIAQYVQNAVDSGSRIVE